MASPKVAALQLRLHMPPLAPEELAAASRACAFGRAPIKLRGRALYCEHLSIAALALADPTPPSHIVAVATYGGQAVVFT